MVPVVVFLRAAGNAARRLRLGGDRHVYLDFHYLRCALAELAFDDYRDSENLVARLNLPNMRYPAERRIEVYAQAVRGLSDLEPDPERRLKYLDFIDIYAALDDNERRRYAQDYPNEAQTMSHFAERFREEGMQQGMQQGMQKGIEQGLRQGEARVLARLLRLKFGELSGETHRRIERADEGTLLLWSERVLVANRVEDVLR